MTAVYLGAYDDETSAARAYDLAALKYWGPGTLINFKVQVSSNSFFVVSQKISYRKFHSFIIFYIARTQLT